MHRIVWLYVEVDVFEDFALFQRGIDSCDRYVRFNRQHYSALTMTELLASRVERVA
jgi:hypothetical protein